MKLKLLLTALCMVILSISRAYSAPSLCLSQNIIISDRSILTVNQDFLASMLFDLDRFKNNGKISDILVDLLDNSVWAKNILTDKQKVLLSNAIDLLYIDKEKDIKTQRYIDYIDVNSHLQKLYSQLDQATDENEIAELYEKIEVLEARLKHEIGELKIKSALFTIDSLGRAPIENREIYLGLLNDNQRKSTSGDQFHTVDTDRKFSDLLIQSADWSKVEKIAKSIEILPNNENSVYVECNIPNSSSKSISLPPGSRISYLLRDFPLSMPWLEIGFFKLDSWYYGTLEAKGTVSDGVFTGDLASTEIFPSVPGSASIVKNALLEFGSDISLLKEVYELYNEGNIIKIDGIAFSGLTSVDSNFVGPIIMNGKLLFPYLQIVKISLEEIPYSPNPNETYDW